MFEDIHWVIALGEELIWEDLDSEFRIFQIIGCLSIMLLFFFCICISLFVFVCMNVDD